MQPSRRPSATDSSSSTGAASAAGEAASAPGASNPIPLHASLPDAAVSRDRRQPSSLLLLELGFALLALYAGWQVLANAGPLAGSRWPGNVEARQLARERMAARLGLSASVAYDDATGRISGQVTPIPWLQEIPPEAPIPGLLHEDQPEDEYRLSQPVYHPDPPAVRRLLITLSHPQRRELDVRIVVPFHADGSFSVTMPRLAPGKWKLALEDESGAWRLGGQWDWPAQQTAELGTKL